MSNLHHSVNIPITTIEHFLSHVKTLRFYEEKLIRSSGEGFNIFDITGYWEDLDSGLMAALLDPNGSHGQGSAFLLNFLRIVGIDDFDGESARVEREVSIGPRTDATGGRIDIVISSGSQGRRIFIENKLNAAEQNNQLARYHAYDRNADIVFLTDDGRPPKTISSENHKLKCISRSNHMLAWLRLCRADAATTPSVREILTHYIHLVEKRTGQNTSAQMNKEIINTVLKDKDTYLAYVALANAHEEIRKRLVSMLDNQLKRIATDEGWEVAGEFSDTEERWSGFFVTIPEFKSHNLIVGIEFDGANYQNPFFGVKYIDKDREASYRDLIPALFRDRFGHSNKPTEYWPAWAWGVNGSYRKSNDELFGDIISGELALCVIKPLFQDLIAIVRQAMVKG